MYSFLQRCHCLAREAELDALGTKKLTGLEQGHVVGRGRWQIATSNGEKVCSAQMTMAFGSELQDPRSPDFAGDTRSLDFYVEF